MFQIKKSSILRQNDTESTDKVSFLVGLEQWGENEDHCVFDFLFTQSDTVDESIEYCITEHVREVLAHDPLVEVKFVKKFSWE